MLLPYYFAIPLAIFIVFFIVVCCYVTMEVFSTFKFMFNYHQDMMHLILESGDTRNAHSNKSTHNDRTIDKFARKGPSYYK